MTEPRPRKQKKVVEMPPALRNLEFIGDHENSSIVLGDYGDAKITAKGNFTLSGIVLCRKNTLEIFLEGSGTLSLKGHCKTLIIHNISGDCTLDVTDLACRKFKCLSATGKASVLLGRTRVIEDVVLGNDAYVRYPKRAVLEHHSITDNARLEPVGEAA
jgi:hypothetical protein